MGNPVIFDPGVCETSGQSLFKKNNNKMNDLQCYMLRQLLQDLVCLNLRKSNLGPTATPEFFSADKLFGGIRTI